MNLKIITIFYMSAISLIAASQAITDTNRIDQQGRKQGYWVKKFPNGNKQYEGMFRDDHPAGEFKRFYDDKTVSSILIYSSDGKTADARMFHPNGFIAARGKYIDQMKEGKWEFFSSVVKGFLINEEYFSKNLRNGFSLKFYSDSTVAEKIRYVMGKKEGEWLQYYQGGKLFLKSNYSGGLLNGKFEVWFENGNNQISGTYKNNLRDGKWSIFNEDGSLKYEISYTDGNTSDRRMDIEAEEFIDNLEKNKGKTADPEKTGLVR